MSEDTFEVETGAIDLAAGIVHTPTGAVSLSPAETRVTRLLAARAGREVAKSEIAALLGAEAAKANSRAVDVVVSRLRRKLGDDGRRPRVLVTVHGVGYRLEPAQGRVAHHDALTSFVGRGQELAWLQEAVATSRAVMVIGPSGSGKTRLVTRALAGMVGVTWTEGRFSSRAEGTLAIAAALGSQARTEAEATEAIRRLDGRERRVVVIDGAAVRSGHTRSAVERALVVSSRLCIVVIGLCDLEIAGAHSVWVGPLPPAEAVALLLDRARSVSPGFAREESDDAHCRAIAARLDLLPGAIEAVAPLARTLSPAELATELGRVGSPFRAPPPSVRLLHDLLPPADRALLSQLCAFRAEFSVRDASKLAGADVGDAIANLASLGLLAREEDRGTSWFRLYQSTRAACDPPGDAYDALAACRLRPVDALIGPTSIETPRTYLATLRRWQADLEWVHARAEERGRWEDAARATLTLDPLTSTFGVDLEAHVQRLDASLWNIGDPMLEAAVARARAWAQRLLGRHEAAVRDARAAVALLEQPSDTFLAARARLTLATVLADGGSIDECLELAREALARCDQEGWHRLRAVALNTMGVAHEVRGDPEAARDAFTAAVAAAEFARDGERAAASLVNLAGTLTRLGNFAQAEACCRRSEQADPDGAPLLAAGWSTCLGNLALAREDAAEALACYERSAALHAATGQARGEVLAGTNAGWALLDLGRHEQAIARLGRAASLARALGGGLPLARALLGLTVAHTAEGRPDAARTVLAEATRLAEATDAARTIAFARLLAVWLGPAAQRRPEALDRLVLGVPDDELRQTVDALTGRARGPLTAVQARVLQRLDARKTPTVSARRGAARPIGTA